MTNTPPTIDELRESFNRVYDGPDRLQREYDLVMESERLGVPLDTYRRLYELRGEEHMNPYPKPKNWQYAPREWLGTGINLTYPVECYKYFSISPQFSSILILVLQNGFI
ncbi:hypothetical protein DSM106972_095120 [Dulcicalothrix desertica PCC 7102]|uniref:Uncharacterized protein n=1 Tax=Dulcicalothrix desertica PCC 7102 TaxID=232991 RepID=A0A3S1A5T4_9CYAN|nr:hypothetical protein [Dulcicalothrix desertica]RUS93913.1 hypothetical protein DSM106972_095120 [Dulcicalothrix desertica PCC 7102]